MKFYKIPFFLFLLFSTLVFSQVTITNFPENLQLYKRDTTSNLATVTVSGNVHMFSGYNSLTLDVYRDGNLLNSYQQSLQYETNHANFNFSVPIAAGLYQYDFQLRTDTFTILKEAINVVAGDVYVMNGQSNAIRNSYANSPYPFSNDFVRTYLLDTQEWSTDSNPFVFGEIGYLFAESVVANHNVPIVLINGGESGMSISNFFRNDANATDQDTNYGRLLSRYQQAGFAPGDVTGFIWFQGEANPFTDIDVYTAAFTGVYNDWEEDYAPENYYFFQVRYGCQLNGYTDYRRDFNAPEAHRRFGLLPRAQLISTNSITKGNDLCHYYGTDGYSELANRLYNLIAYDHYNSFNNSGIYSPNVANVRFTSSLKNQIEFELIPATDTYTWQNGVENDFWIEGNNLIQVVSGSISGNVVTLNLSESVTTVDPKLSYLGHNPEDTPFIVNQNNIGMLSFKNESIQETLGVQEVTESSFSMYPNPANQIVTIIGKKPANIVVFDSTGRKVFEQQNNSLEAKIDVSTWSSGQYFIKITTQEASSVKMLIVS